MESYEFEEVDGGFLPPEMALHERVIFLTGATGGIGHALAVACASLGATVVLSGRKMRPLEKLYDKIQASGAPEPALYPIDLEGASPADYEKLNDVMLESFGRLDAIAHLAAKLDGLTPLSHIDPERWMRSMQVNLNAPVLMIQACREALRQSESPRIILADDHPSRSTKAYWGAYGAGKAAAAAYAAILANETDKSSLGIALVDPGETRTQLRTNSYPGIQPDQWPAPAEVLGPFLRALSDPPYSGLAYYRRR